MFDLDLIFGCVSTDLVDGFDDFRIIHTLEPASCGEIGVVPDELKPWASWRRIAFHAVDFRIDRPTHRAIPKPLHLCEREPLTVPDGGQHRSFGHRDLPSERIREIVEGQFGAKIAGANRDNVQIFRAQFPADTELLE